MASIIQHHQFDAPPRTVFQALTDPEILCTWWTSAAQSDPQIGGEFRYEFHHTPAAIRQGKTDMVQEGRYIECDASHIQYPWAVGAVKTNVRFILNIRDGGTDLKLTHSGIPDDDAIVDALTEGWEFFLGNLATVLSGGPDARAKAGIAVGTTA